jgi:hypothetical protein
MRKWHSLVNIAPNGPDTDFLVINWFRKWQASF